MKKRLWAMAALLALFLTGCGQPDTPVTVPPPDNGNVEATEATDFTVTPIDPAVSRELRDQAYTNVPGTPTQNAVLDYTITFFPETEEKIVYPVTVLEPDELIVERLSDIYEFVQETEKMTVRYFPEEVQKQVQEILKGGSVDILHGEFGNPPCPDGKLRPVGNVGYCDRRFVGGSGFWRESGFFPRKLPESVENCHCPGKNKEPKGRILC